MPSTRLADGLVDILRDERRVVSTDSVLDEHAADFSFHAPRRPDVVVYPVDAAEVAAILAFANGQRVPVVAFGAGTSLEGHNAQHQERARPARDHEPWESPPLLDG